MGGFGSGRLPGAATTNDFHAVDLADFTGQLISSGVMTWSRGGVEIGGAEWHLGYRTLRMTYRQGSGKDAQLIDATLKLERTQTAFSGERSWMICPGKRCGGRRCRIVYLGPNGPLCRKCYGLRYQSQREPAHTRHLAQALRIKMKLGGEMSPIAPFPEKPSGLHWKTYDKLVDKYWRLCSLAAA